MNKTLICFFFFAIMCFSFTKSNAQYQVVPQTGHNRLILALEYSPDGKYLATAGHDIVILLWDTRTGLHWRLHGHGVGVEKLAFSPDNGFLVSTDFGGNVIVWDLKTRKIVSRIKNNSDEDAFFKIQFLNNEEIAMLNGKMFKIWNFKTNTVTQKVPIKGSIFALNTKESTVLLLEYKTSLSTTSGFTESYKMVLYDLKKLSPLDDSWLRGLGSKFVNAEFSATGKYLVLADAEKIVVADYKSKRKLWEAPIPATPRKIIITPDEGRVIFCGNFETPDLFIYDLQTGKQLQHRVQFTDFSFAYNHQNQVVAGSRDAAEYGRDPVYPISIYDLRSQGIIRTLYPNNYMVEQVAWNNNTNQLFVQGNGKVFVWDLTLSSIIQSEVSDFRREITDWKKGTVYANGDGQPSYYFSPGGKLKGGVTNPETGTVDVVDMKSGQTVFSLPDGNMFGLAFSNDNQKLYRATGDDLYAYDLKTGSQINHLHYTDASIARIALSLDGKYLAVGKFRNEGTRIMEKFYATDFTIDLIDPATFKVIRKLEGHSMNVTSLDFTGDNRFLISGSMDGSIRFWNPETGEQKFILYGDSPSDYFMQADNGYYSSSKAAIEKVAFSYGGQIIPGKIFEIQMNRPDKVGEATGYSTAKIITALGGAFRKRIEQLSISEDQLKIEELPVLAVTSTLPPPTVSTKVIGISYEATDNLSKLDHIKLLVNNVPIFGTRGYLAKSKSEVKGKFEVTLTEGLNSIEISAVNAKGASSIPVSFDVFCTVKSKPDLYLVTIGIDKFLDQDYNLNYAAKDAQDIAALFESKKSNYGKFVHLPFSGIKATKDNILTAKATLSQSKPDDVVIIFAATHGLLDEKYDYYLATYNMMFDKPAFQGLAYNELEGLVDGIPARKKLILLDACHSGEIDASEVTASSEAINDHQGVKARGFKPVKKTSSIGLENSFDLMKNLFADLREGTGATVISSAGGVEFAFESGEWNNGVFTYSLLEGIKSRNADSNQDGNINLSELRSYVFTKVKELTNGKQNPSSRVDNIDNDFAIISTIGNTDKIIDMAGTWSALETWDAVDSEFTKVTDKTRQYSPDKTITKGVDGFFYIGTSIKLFPIGTNQYKDASNQEVIVENPNTIVIKDTYGITRYVKAN